MRYTTPVSRRFGIQDARIAHARVFLKTRENAPSRILVPAKRQRRCGGTGVTPHILRFVKKIERNAMFCC